jgi:hypothetical protein
MRLNILVIALMSSATMAQAGSIDTIKTGKDAARSIEKISCLSCIKKPKKAEQSVVELAPGTQKIEIREVGGVRKIYRTESWLGGSPVVIVSKAMAVETPVLADAQPDAADTVASAPATISEKPAVAAEVDMIDEKSTTAAVTADIGAEMKVKVAPKTESFDASKLELRLN